MVVDKTSLLCMEGTSMGQTWSKKVLCYLTDVRAEGCNQVRVIFMDDDIAFFCLSRRSRRVFLQVQYSHFQWIQHIFFTCDHRKLVVDG